MRVLGRRKVFYLLLLCFLSQSLDLGASLNDEGWALLSFRERVEVDPFGVLLNWDEDDMDPCLWFGVDCSDDGRVVALNLRDLCLQGTLAPELGTLIHLKYIILHNNSFSGIIPREIANLQKLEVLDLGYNNLNGPLPSELESIPSLEILILRSNLFLFNISPKLDELIMLSDVQVGEQLSSNKESFSRYIGKGPTRKLIQVFNKHKGSHQRHSQRNRKDHRGIQLIHALLSPSSSPSPVPSVTHSRVSSEAPAPSPFYPRVVSPAPAPAFSSSSTTRPQLNNHPNKTISPSAFTLIPSPARYPSLGANTDSGEKHAIYWTIYAPVAAGVSFLLAVAAVYILCCRGNKVVTVRPWATGLSGQLQKAFVTGVPSLRRSEIEAACEYFSNIVGSLSDCMIYKGTLSSGVEIAVISSMVTSSKDWSKQCEAQFRKKISTLSKVNHKNFVNLLGYCEESEPFTRMMVFEYAPNGTLFEHLHIKEAEHLDWAARLRIAMGIAYCLEHLHHLNPPVLLRNLDSASIYLTDDFAAKVSDIGFWSEAKESKLALEELDPLDPQASELDVYKFGILLLEIISGRLPFCEDHGLLVLWALSYLTGKRPLKEMIDTTLESVRDEDINAICDVIRLCIYSDITMRPTMSQVVGKLREITAIPPDGAVPKLSPLWWAELEIISTEAN